MNRTSSQYNRNGRSNRTWVITLFLLLLLAVFKGLFGQDDTPTAVVETGNEISYEFRKTEYLEEHFEKHGAEFNYTSAQEYLEGANRVVNAEDVLSKVEEEDGDAVYYLERTNELVIISTDGYIRTYFRPEDGIDYFNRQ